MRFRVLTYLTAVATIAAGISTAPCPSAQAGEPLRDALQDVVTHIESVIRLEGANSVQLGLITPANSDPMSSYGRRIAAFLRQELEHQDIQVSRKSSLRVAGTYAFDAKDGTISISTKIIDERGRTVDSLQTERVNASLLRTEVKDTTELMLVANVSIAVERDDKDDQILERIEDEDAAENGKLTLDDGWLVMNELGLAMRLREVNPRHKPTDPGFFGEVVRANNALKDHFTLLEGSSYAVELKNLKSDVDFACKVLFDGIDTFVLCDDSEKKTDFNRGGRRVPKYQYWIVRRGQTTFVPGWFKNLHKVHAFQIVPDEESVAYALGSPQGIGSIQVLVTAAWPKGSEVDDKYRIPAAVRGARPRGGGGEGQAIEVDLKPVEMETGIVLGALSAEYMAN